MCQFKTFAQHCSQHCVQFSPNSCSFNYYHFKLHNVCFCLSVSVSFPHPSFVPLTFHLSCSSSPTVLTRPPHHCSTPSLTLRFRLAKARNPVQPAAGMSCLSCCVCVYVCVKLVRLVLLFDFDVFHCLRAKLLPAPAFPKRL